MSCQFEFSRQKCIVFTLCNLVTWKKVKDFFSAKIQMDKVRATKSTNISQKNFGQLCMSLVWAIFIFPWFDDFDAPWSIEDWRPPLEKWTPLFKPSYFYQHLIILWGLKSDFWSGVPGFFFERSERRRRSEANLAKCGQKWSMLKSLAMDWKKVQKNETIFFREM